MKIFNSLSRTKEDFEPLNPPRVTMYSCGITPQNHPHLGHAVAAIRFSMIRRYLTYLGYEVCFVENVTDVDDKIINRAAELHLKPHEVADKYLKEYKTALSDLGLPIPNHSPRVTEYIDEIIRYIEALIKKDFAYATPDGDVYFDLEKKEDYGKLSRRKTDELLSGTRITTEGNKRNALDFALWKQDDTPGASWDSPWGKGRPGWHIECSAMSNSLLGATIDIHCGGLDLIFPHHENEIAQCEAHNGVEFTKYWVHCGLLEVNGSKMSKSSGNFFTINDALERYGKELITFVIHRHHYRSPIDFNDKLFKDNINSLCEFYWSFDEALLLQENIEVNLENKLVQTMSQEFEAAMEDDFNTPVALVVLSKYLKEAEKKGKEGDQETKLAIHKNIIRYGRVLGLFSTAYNLRKILEELLKFQQFSLGVKEMLTVTAVENILGEREKARAEKMYQKSDELRDLLSAHGIKVMDAAQESNKWQFLIVNA